MKYLVADDDPLVCETVESFLLRFEVTQFCLKVHDGLTALQLLSEGTFDAAFLDVNMPGLGGQEVLKVLPQRVPIVIVSASGDFAAASYEFRVCDYLLKPLTFPRFAQAVTRIQETLAFARQVPVVAETQADGGTGLVGREIFIKDGTRMVRLHLDAVWAIRAEANYVEFLHDGGTTLSLMPMKRVEKMLPEGFVRTHRSWIVNWRRISKIEDGFVYVHKERVPVSDGFRQQLFQAIPVLE